MIVFLFFIILFIYITNFLYPCVIEKQKMDQKVFNTANQNLMTTVSCINNVWILISRNNRNVNISYYERNKIPVTCDLTPNNQDTLINCGKQGRYNEFDGPCYNTLVNLMYLLS